MAFTFLGRLHNIETTLTQVIVLNRRMRLCAGARQMCASAQFPRMTRNDNCQYISMKQVWHGFCNMVYIDMTKLSERTM